MHDDDFVGRRERLREVARLLAVDEDADVAPDAVLLVDDAKANACVLALEVGEQRGEGGAARLGLAALGVGEQRAAKVRTDCAEARAKRCETAAAMRIVVLGGSGNFGARICRALGDDSSMQVLAAGRSSTAAPIDIVSPEFPAALRRLAPDIVIHCAGPFQGQDYRVASAALAAGAHYIDLADGRAFVAGFAQAMDGQARAADRIALSGASTLPALSSAVVDELARRFARIEEIEISIAPGQRAPRGAATLAAVFGYAGRPLKWLSGGAWRNAWGWRELKRLRFAKMGTRWAAACDVPDLELFPTRYPGVRTVEFRAALELSLEHFALWAAAALRRIGVPLPLDPWAGPLDGLASMLDRFGGEYGGMLVAVTGTKPDGMRARLEWHLTAPALDGPEIPCMAAILLARRLARGEIAERGAFACMGFLALADFAPEFARWRMSASIEENPA
jgi:hypothetical protein